MANNGIIYANVGDASNPQNVYGFSVSANGIDILARANSAFSNWGRNRIINGDHYIDQRNEGTAKTITSGAAIVYTVDRWYANCTGANQTIQRVAGLATGNKYGLKITGATSGTNFSVGQRIEANNCYDLVNQTVTVSSNISSNALSTINWVIYAPNTTDNYAAKSVIANGTLSISNTITSYSFSFTATANVANGLSVEFNTGALVANQGAQIESVQLELGSQATSFERISYGERLRNCQRYYWKSFPQGVVPASQLGYYGLEGVQLAAGATGQVLGWWSFPCTMRTLPNFNTYNPVNANGNAYNQTAAADWSGTSVAPRITGFTISGTSPGGGGSGQFTGIDVTADAEIN